METGYVGGFYIWGKCHTLPLLCSVRYYPGLFCQACARSVPLTGTPSHSALTFPPNEGRWEKYREAWNLLRPLDTTPKKHD